MSDEAREYVQLADRMAVDYIDDMGTQELKRLRPSPTRRWMGRSHGLGAPRHGIVFLQPAQRNVGTDLRAPGDWNTVSIARSISDFG
jgi:hypothetical protein